MLPHLFVDGVVVLYVITNDMSYSQCHYYQGIIPIVITILLNCDDR